MTDRKAKPSFVLLGHCLPSCLNFWQYNSQRCILFRGRTSSNHAFCFVFKTLMPKNRKNKWSISATVIVVCCLYLTRWPNKYIFTNVFFYVSTVCISPIQLWSICSEFQFLESFSGCSNSGLETVPPLLYSSAPGAQQTNLLILWWWFDIYLVGKTKAKNFSAGKPQRNSSNRLLDFLAGWRSYGNVYFVQDSSLQPM